MISIAGPLHLLAVVLIVSGAAKLIDPAPAATAMRDGGLPIPFRGSPVTGIALGAVEAAIGLVAIAVPAWWAATLLGAVYLGFAGFILRLRARDGEAGCGCFGSSSTPPGTAHLVLNLSAVVVVAVAVIGGVPDIVEVFDDGIGVGVGYVALLTIGAATVLVAPALSAQISRIRSGELPRPFAPVTRS